MKPVNHSPDAAKAGGPLLNGDTSVQVSSNANGGAVFALLTDPDQVLAAARRASVITGVVRSHSADESPRVSAPGLRRHGLIGALPFGVQLALQKAVAVESDSPEKKARRIAQIQRRAREKFPSHFQIAEGEGK